MKSTSKPRIGPGEKFLRAMREPWPLECVKWPLSCNPVSGYGQVVLGGKKMSAHRASALLHHGAPADASFEVAHSCGNRACCNPSHLRWTTRASNHADKHIHGTMMQGEDHVGAKLWAEGVLLARRLASAPFDRTHADIAQMLGVSRAAVSMAIERRTWRHVA